MPCYGDGVRTSLLSLAGLELSIHDEEELRGHLTPMCEGRSA